MADMLIKLYDLPPAQPLAPGLVVRKPIGPEHRELIAWIEQRFGTAWAGEAEVALANRPVTLLIAQQDEGAPLGFAAYDATARGMLGPIGVADDARRLGTGAALLQAALADMRAAGYAYAVAGAVGPAEFFQRVAGAVEIPGSAPGIYRGRIRRPT